MKFRRNLVAVLAVLALLQAAPVRADWNTPDPGPIGGSEMTYDDVIVAAQWGYQIALAAF